MSAKPSRQEKDGREPRKKLAFRLPAYRPGAFSGDLIAMSGEGCIALGGEEQQF
jgi:hypothetical protein